MIDRFTNYTNKPTLYSVIKAFQQETFAKLNCMKIGIIDEILLNNQVRCSITNKKIVGTNPDGTSILKNYPPIFAKVYYMGSGNTGINYPLSVGSPCLLLFNDREFNSYFETGEISALASTRMHSLNDCICLPLYQADSDIDLSLTSGTITLDGNIINLSASSINLNADTININGNLIINGIPFTDHVHSNGNQGANTGGVV